MRIDNFNTPPKPSVAPKNFEEPIPHSGDARIEFPVVAGVEPISEEVVANTEIPNTVTAGLGEAGSVAAGEKATWDQLREEQAKTNSEILQNRQPASMQAGFSRQDEKPHTSLMEKIKQHPFIAGSIGSVAVLGLAATTYFAGASANHDTKNNTDPSKTVATAPAIADAIETAPAVVYQPEVNPANCPTVDKAPNSAAKVAPVSIVECGNFTDLSPEQKQFVLKNEQMSTTEFYAQPMQDQLKFANYVVENRANVGQTILNNNLTQLGLAQYGLVPNYEHSQNSKDLDNAAVGQMNATFQAIVYGSVTTDASGTIKLDKTTAKKMLVQPLLYLVRKCSTH